MNSKIISILTSTFPRHVTVITRTRDGVVSCQVVPAGKRLRELETVDNLDSPLPLLDSKPLTFPH